MMSPPPAAAPVLRKLLRPRLTAPRISHPLSHRRCGGVYRLADAIIGSARTDMARHRPLDLRVAWVLVLRKQRRRGHDLSRLAIAALRNLLRDPGLLDRMIAIPGETFDSDDRLARSLRYLGAARTHRLAVQMNRACAAERGAATELGPGEPECVAQHP